MTSRTLCITRGVFALLALAASSPVLHADAHRYVPTTFYTTLSSAHPPALRIKTGDTVSTATLDDQGADAAGKVLAEGPSPQTGPFYVEGAEPGDLLVVTIAKLTPNRTTGTSTSVMVPASLDAGTITSKPDLRRVAWTIDPAKGVVRLDLQAVVPNTDWKTRFATPVFELPLRPSLGSIGVAPATGPASATTAGPFGGSVFSTAITAGARVMLPVLQPGALLFLGGGRANAGDGDITGTGIDTSMDVEFSVELVKKKEWPHSSVVRPSTVVGEFEMGWPRIETADYVMTVGTASTLGAAMQHATTELHHWLDDDFGLSEKTVSILVGQVIEYEISRVAESSATVVAKVRKTVLPRAAQP